MMMAHALAAVLVLDHVTTRNLDGTGSRQGINTSAHIMNQPSTKCIINRPLSSGMFR